MKKKNIIIIAAIAVVCIAAYILLAVVPVYPLRVKEAASYTEMSVAMEKKGIFAPTEEKLPFTVEKTDYLLDGTARLSPVLGYSATGTIDYKDTTVHCELFIRNAEHSKEIIADQYPLVECSQLSVDFTEGPGWFTEAVFSYGDHAYTLFASYLRDDTGDINDYVARKLTRSAALILMQAGVEGGSYPILPKELTDGWSIVQPNGRVHITAAAVPRGDTIYYLTAEEYQQVADGADPDEVLAARWEWYKEETEEPVVPIVPDPEPVYRPEGIELTEAEAATAFSFHIDGQAISLGIRDDDYPWDYEGFPETAEYFATGDHGEKIYSFPYGGVLVSYYTHGEGEEFGSHITSMVTSEPGPATPRGIVVGDTVERMAEIYPEAVYCPFYEYGSDDTMPYFDSVYIYEPGGHGSCKHIGFYVTDGIITTIEIGDMIDGRILD